MMHSLLDTNPVNLYCICEKRLKSMPFKCIHYYNILRKGKFYHNSKQSTHFFPLKEV